VSNFCAFRASPRHYDTDRNPHRKLDASFYCRVKPQQDGCKPFPEKGNTYSAFDLVQKAIRDKPGSRHPLGEILIRPSPRSSNAAKISLYNLVSCMYNYPFRRGTDVDIDAVSNTIFM
jgi:hypothetical protein